MIDDVATKFSTHALVESTVFFCRHDPLRPGLKLQIGFGAHLPGCLTGCCVPVDRAFNFTSLEFSVFDDENKPLKLESKFKWIADGYSFIARSEGVPLGWKNMYSHQNGAKGKWRIICDVGYVGNLPEDNSEPISDVTRLQNDFLKLLNTEDQSDVTFVVQGESIKTHKNILMARCPYFERMFNSQMKESDDNQVIITDFCPEVFRELLKFLYASQQPKFQDTSSTQARR